MNQKIITFSIIIIFIVTGILLLVYTGNSKDNFTSTEPFYNWRVNDSSGLGYGVAYRYDVDEPNWVAVGQGSIKYSRDGENWNNSYNDFNNALGVAHSYNYNEDKPNWVAVGQVKGKAAIKYSDDGKKIWNNSDSNTNSDGTFYGVGHGNNLWVAVGEGDKTIKYSKDGENWDNDFDNNDFDREGLGVAYANGRWVAVGTNDYQSYFNGTIKYSDDGKKWNDIDNNENNSGGGYGGFSLEGHGVAYGNGMWVAVGMDHLKHTIKYSKDGKKWTDVDNAFDGIGLGVAYGNNLWVAVGKNIGTNDNEPKIKYSHDGKKWNDLTINNINITINEMNGLAFSDEKLVITGLFNDTKSFLIADLSPKPAPSPSPPLENCYIPKQTDKYYIYSTQIEEYDMIIKIPENMLNFTLENDNFKFMFYEQGGSLVYDNILHEFKNIEDINIIDKWKPITDIFDVKTEYRFSYNDYKCNNEINNNKTILNNVKFAWKVIIPN